MDDESISESLNSFSRASKPSVNNSQLSTESVLNYIYDNFETIEAEPETQLTIKNLIINPHKSDVFSTYQSCFLLTPNSRKLFRKFLKDKFKLINSDTKTVNFSIKEILFRLNKGYTVYKYKSKKKTRKQVMVKIEESVVKIRNSSAKCCKRLPFDGIFGVVLGCETYSFRKSKEKIDRVCGEIHDEHDCFSIVTDVRSLDFACVNEIAMYDICIGISWLAYHYNPVPTSIPYSKCKIYSVSLTAMIVWVKIREMAQARYMSGVELFLVRIIQLAICKTLKEKKRDYTGILGIINKRFTGAGKVARMVERSILRIVREEKLVEQFKYTIKANFLADSMNNTEKNLKDITQVLRQKNRKETKFFSFVAFFVPSLKGIFEKPKKDDKSRVRFSAHSSMRFTTTLRHIHLSSILK